MKLFEYRSGTVPLMISIPHGGTWIPDDIRHRLNGTGKKIKDTDWFLVRLYDFAELADASLISANVSRYVVDLNRSKHDTNLYPGQNTTGLCPLKSFAGEDIYLPGMSPDQSEVETRIATYWDPYHARLRAELDRIVGKFGFAVLLDAHSIASELPWLFSGRLPDFNFGTDHGKSCDASLHKSIQAFSNNIKQYSAVVNGRFVGGFITRNYGQMENVNAVQLELSQATYMDEINLAWDQNGVDRVQPVIRSFVMQLRQWDGS